MEEDEKGGDGGMWRRCEEGWRGRTDGTKKYGIVIQCDIYYARFYFIFNLLEKEACFTIYFVTSIKVMFSLRGFNTRRG